MPFITKLLPLREREHVGAFPDSSSLSLHVQDRLEQVREEKDLDHEYGGFEEYNHHDDEILDSDMEGSILHRPRPKKAVKAPSLPQRSEKRASKILDNVMQELKALGETVKEEADRASIVQESDPHELYLSSEEDASLSDDYEGSLMDFEGSDDEEPRGRSSTSSQRKSQEVTARVVSFIVVGKPQIVDIFNTSPTNSVPSFRHSMNLDTLASLHSKLASSSPSEPTSRRPAPLKLYPSTRRLSISSTTSYIPQTSNSLRTPIMQNQNASMMDLSMIPSHTTSQHAQVHPARKSSRLGLSNLTSLVTNHSYTSYSLSNRKASLTSNPTPITSSSSHPFLESDPFAHSHHNHGQHTHQEATHNLPPSPIDSAIPMTPKTPTSMATWKKGLSRTLSKAKATRKQSIPKLNAVFQLHGQTQTQTQTQAQAHPHQHSEILSQAQASTSTLSVASSSRDHPRSSTSHSHTSTITTSSNPTPEQSSSNLARIASNPEPATPQALDAPANAIPAQTAVRRSETMPIAAGPASPRNSTFGPNNNNNVMSGRESKRASLVVGRGYKEDGLTYEEVMRQVAARGPPPMPVDEREKEKEKEKKRDGRRSFAMIGMGMGMGMGRRKSVKR